VVGSDSVTEILELSDGRRLRYTQVEDGFSNPNGHVNAKALDWICSCITQAAASLFGSGEASSSSDGEVPVAADMDVLELFCGNGNHTVAIAGIV
jgi:tRNA/tmRNA/rRNA uracil-C5-methylase (TrmA/RlmC/RlmD family)